MHVTPLLLSLANYSLPMARHLPADLDPRVRLAIVRAALDILSVVEEPLGSNRSPVIDVYLRNAGVPESVILAGKGYWCAAAVGQWWQDAGLETPLGRADCDVWMRWAKKTGRWSNIPTLGAAVLYGKPGDATHIGLIARVTPLVMSVEGNTTIESGFDRNGIAVTDKIVDPKSDPILGYCQPLPAATLPKPPGSAA